MPMGVNIIKFEFRVEVEVPRVQAGDFVWAKEQLPKAGERGMARGTSVIVPCCRQGQPFARGAVTQRLAREAVASVQLLWIAHGTSRWRWRLVR